MAAPTGFEPVVPLKVGITYAFGPNEPDAAAQRNSRAPDVLEHIRREFAKVSIGEDPATEYLFLLGYREPQLVIRWRSLAFSAGANLDALAFA